MTALRLQRFTDQDMAAMHRMNQSAVPATGSVDIDALAALCRQAAAVPVRYGDDGLHAFMIVLDQGADYASPNFLWFRQRFERFLYVDRVVVDARHRGRGIGRALYADAAALAVQGALPVTCEVNVEPPNPQSMAFHEGLGFESLAEQYTEGGHKRVRLLIHRAPEALLPLARGESP